MTHYYPKLGVAEIIAVGDVKLGDEFLVIGETSGVVEGTIKTMHRDAGEIDKVTSGDVFSIKVPNRVRRNDKFFLLKSAKSQMSGV